jgi:hypothetical protein
MRACFRAVALLSLFVAASAMAQETAPGRYTMIPVDEGMLRLDTKTGVVSQCARDAGKWVCITVADDRIALENEIDRLSNENQQLRAQLEKGGSVLPPEMKPNTEVPNNWLPDDKRVDEFMSFFEKIMRRFKQMAESMQDDTTPERP